ncbi:ribonuclease P protein component [Dyadobacter sp. 676]|uniref:Ribonuclease P protein component n=1 Tax=Dyadobacter sp. 676 TaxID=3088362 RepID=A0AAU8FRZ5_9BACT
MVRASDCATSVSSAGFSKKAVRRFKRSTFFRSGCCTCTPPKCPPPLPQVLFSVSKRHFKKAVDRNLIRRRCREAYRLHKSALAALPAETRPSYIAFLYLAKEITSYDVIETAMKQSLKKLEKLPPAFLKEQSNS